MNMETVWYIIDEVGDPVAGPFATFEEAQAALDDADSPELLTIADVEQEGE